MEWEAIPIAPRQPEESPRRGRVDERRYPCNMDGMGVDLSELCCPAAVNEKRSSICIDARE